MTLMKTDKTSFNEKEILEIIDAYEKTELPKLNRLWEYYEGRNSAILHRQTGILAEKEKDSTFTYTDTSSKNTPDVRLPVPYARKIITTFTGYAYRPKYVSYKPIEVKQELKSLGMEPVEVESEVEPIEDTTDTAPKNVADRFKDNKVAFVHLMRNYRLNNEHIKVSRAGRNTGIFGVSYELLFLDGVLDQETLSPKAEVKFITVDPREMILLYDFSSEPKKVAAIRFYQVTKDKYIVEVYYPSNSFKYERTKSTEDTKSWTLKQTDTGVNYFGEVPVVPYYFGDEMMGLIEPIIPLIDAYDVLLSDSMNEFDRFANAYLVMKRFGLTDPLKKKDPGVISQALMILKRYRVFEYLDKDADVKFLTKDIPDGYIRFMTDLVQRQIHTQSHVPDFAGEKFTGASGIAIQRLLFDFENVCSDAEADFDVGLYERIRMIYAIYSKLGRAKGDYSVINIAHKRNSPLNLQEYANTAVLMKNAGFSSWLVADIMPDDVVPDVEEELDRQKEERDELMETTLEQQESANKDSPTVTDNPNFGDQGKSPPTEEMVNGLPIGKNKKEANK